jgi:hypothetical protein
LLKKIAASGTLAAERWGLTQVQAAATAAEVKPEEAAPLIRACAIPGEQKDLIAELLPLAMEEWGLDPSVSPTACLCGIAGTWFYGIRQAVGALEAMKTKATPPAATEGPGASVLKMPTAEGVAL